LESLNDVVEAITGVAQRETVPDSVVRAAELVDMAPEALRRRMTHGNTRPRPAAVPTHRTWNGLATCRDTLSDSDELMASQMRVRLIDVSTALSFRRVPVPWK